MMIEKRISMLYAAGVSSAWTTLKMSGGGNNAVRVGWSANLKMCGCEIPLAGNLEKETSPADVS
jgi:hypothetical protein